MRELHPDRLVNLHGVLISGNLSNFNSRRKIMEFIQIHLDIIAYLLNAHLAYIDRLNFISTCRQFFFSGDKRLDAIKPLHCKINTGHDAEQSVILVEKQLVCLVPLVSPELWHLFRLPLFQPIRIPLKRTPIIVASGGNSLLLSFADGEIHYFESLTSLIFSGQLKKAEILRLPAGVKAKQIVIVEHYSLIRGEDNCVYGLYTRFRSF